MRGPAVIYSVDHVRAPHRAHEGRADFQQALTPTDLTGRLLRLLADVDFSFWRNCRSQILDGR
jgi:hypothetical protein